MKPKIKKFGMEIEGEMSDRLMDELTSKDYGKIVSDGSLRTCSWDKARKYHKTGTSLRLSEFVSKPIEYNRKGIKTAKDIFRLFNKYFKEKEFHWNDSCGFHIHMSFRPKMPVDIWSIQFVKFFTEGLEGKFKTMYAKRKDNTYCKVILNEKEMINSNNRYQAINFKPAYSKHGTIEFRIFQTNRPMTMSKYLEYTISTVKYFLKYSSRFCHKIFEFETDDEMEKPKTRTIERELNEEKNTQEFERLLIENNSNLVIEK